MNDEIIDQLAAVRETGAVNMFDKTGVQRVADECGFDELVAFIDENGTSGYSEALQEMGRRR